MPKKPCVGFDPTISRIQKLNDIVQLDSQHLAIIECLYNFRISPPLPAAQHLVPLLRNSSCCHAAKQHNP